MRNLYKLNKNKKSYFLSVPRHNSWKLLGNFNKQIFLKSKSVLRMPRDQKLKGHSAFQTNKKL